MKRSFSHIPTHCVIGIDPDVDRNGVAILDTDTHSLEILTLSFPELVEFFLTLHYITDPQFKIKVIVEAGWLNHTHWHTHWGDSARVIAAKGNSVGRNHEVGRKIAELCEYWSISYQLVKPLRKMWKGKDGKITAKELETLTGYKGRSNQEGRDAGLLAWVFGKRGK